MHGNLRGSRDYGHQLGGTLAVRYSVKTWDMELQRFTEQPGVPCRHLPLWMLRRAIRLLRFYGYTAHRIRGDSDPYTLIEQDHFPLVVSGK